MRRIAFPKDLIRLIIEVHLLRWSCRKTDICKWKKISIESSHLLCNTNVAFFTQYTNNSPLVPDACRTSINNGNNLAWTWKRTLLNTIRTTFVSILFSKISSSFWFFDKEGWTQYICIISKNKKHSERLSRMTIAMSHLRYSKTEVVCDR